MYYLIDKSCSIHTGNACVIILQGQLPLICKDYNDINNDESREIIRKLHDSSY